MNVKLKIETYCVYQERCHQEVEEKLKQLGADADERNAIIVHLITHNFLNETRFACSFARGKHRIKNWGKIRIVNELKFRNISTFNINEALKEINEDEYLETLNQIAEKIWNTTTEKNVLKKRKKCCDYLLRKGYESHLVYDAIRVLEKRE